MWGTGGANMGFGDHGTRLVINPRVVEFSFGAKIKQVSIGTCFTLAIDEPGCAWAWGADKRLPTLSSVVPRRIHEFEGRTMAVRSLFLRFSSRFALWPHTRCRKFTPTIRAATRT